MCKFCVGGLRVLNAPSFAAMSVIPIGRVIAQMLGIAVASGDAISKIVGVSA